MPAHQDFAAANAKYASSFDKGELALPPAKKVVVGMSLLFVCELMLTF